MKRKRAPKGGCWAAGKFYKGGQFLPKPAPPNKLAAVLSAVTDALVTRVEADDLPPDTGYSQAMIRVLRRRSEPTPRDLRILDNRRRAAVTLLAGNHPDPLVRRHFAGLLASYPNTL